MKTQLTDIRDQQRASWNTFSPGWKKWDQSTMNFLHPMGEAIIRKLYVQPDDEILDIASGTGEPGLTLATMASKGSVTALDISEQMLETAKQKAAARAITNFSVQQGDACELPFENNLFSKISCRMGFMFFPNMQLAASEMFRVLLPNGRMATSVWYNPPQNKWIGSVMSVISKNIPMPPPVSGAPGMFRCAQPGLMTSLLQQAGFKNVEEEEINGKVSYKDFDDFWTQMNEIAAPVVGALSKADEQTRQRIKAELHDTVKPFETTDGLTLDFCALVVSGTK